MNRPPTLQALVLADQVYVDRDTGKHVIAGTFNAVRGTAFPTELGRVTFAYVSLTDVREEITLKMRLVDHEDLKVLMGSSGIVLSGIKDPLRTLELVLPVPSLPMEKPGSYSLELLSNDRLIGSIRIHVMKAEG